MHPGRSEERRGGWRRWTLGRPAPPRGEPRFAHPVERELARLLDRCAVRWRYEPHTFVLARRRDGSVARAFTPDFYLPDLDYYLECTVARRSLTRLKRRKAEAAHRLYGVRVEIVYRSDLERLARRWSLDRLARALERNPEGGVYTPTEAAA